MGVSLNTPEGHKELVSCIAFSHDGALLASASDDNTIKLWDAATGVTLKTLEGHTHSAASVEFFRGNIVGWVPSITFSLDSTLLASASRDKTVRLWDTTTGTALRTLEGHTEVVSSVALSRDGTLLSSSSRDKTVRILDAIIGAALRMLEGHTDEATSTVFSRWNATSVRFNGRDG